MLVLSFQLSKDSRVIATTANDFTDRNRELFIEKYRISFRKKGEEKSLGWKCETGGDEKFAQSRRKFAQENHQFTDNHHIMTCRWHGTVSRGQFLFWRLP